MSVDNADEATAVAEEALNEAGYEGASVGDAHQETSTWIVQADHEGTQLNVHIDADSGESEVAELGE
ncbi:hypothetical protein [Halalkalicoccus tibetensis]|uniref:PepSY domain-containing protein n=1 Tax=Halalkalicoccus tibetensis TaxID=175632 RepID=A0ABD5VB50_9EURY